MGARTRGLANNVLSSGKLDATDAISGTIAAGNIANDSLTSATTFGSVTGGVPAVASDPPSPAEGDIWYNTTTGTIRFRTQLGAWATANDMNTVKFGAQGAGSQTAGLTFGGESGPVRIGNTESYNGTTWTEVADLSTVRGEGNGAGTQTSAIAFHGNSNPTTFLTSTETWNGSSWTSSPSTNSGKLQTNVGGGIGEVSTAALGTGGRNPPTSYLSATESYNGSSWTEVNDLNTARSNAGGAGTNTSAIVAGGSTPSPTAISESWNGTSWTEVADLNNAGSARTASGISNTSAMVIAGVNPSIPAILSNTETWNGTAWTEGGDVNVARYDRVGMGTTTAAAVAGGRGPEVASAEEWTFGVTTATVG